MTLFTSLVASPLFLGLPFFLGPILDAGRPTTAEEVLQLARTRQVGDGESPKNAGILRITGTMQVQQVPMKGDFTELHHPDGRSRMAWTFSGYGDTVEGRASGVFFESSPMGTDIRKGWRAAAAYRILALRRWVPWQVLYSAATLDGTEEVAGEICHRVNLVPRSPVELGFASADEDLGDPPAPDVWFVGQDSHLMHRVDMEVSVPSRGEGTLSLGFSDWRDVDGVLFPYRSTRTMHGFGMEAIADTVELVRELPEDAFVLPEAVQKAIGAPGESAAPPDPQWHVVELESRHTAVVRASCKAEDISRTLASILPEVSRYLREVGAEATSPPFTRYFSVAGGTMEIEAGIAVKQAVEARGRIVPGTLPAGRAASGDHIGEYHTLGKSHMALAAWLEEQGEQAAGAPWEVYWTDPGVEPDPRKWRTQIVQPLVRSAK